MTDTAQTGTDTGVPAPTQAAPTPTPPVDPNNPAGNNTGVSVPPTDQIATSQAPPPHPPQTTNPQVSAQVQPGQTQPAPAQTMPQLPPPPKGVSPDNPYAYHPSVQNASRIRTMAEALGGGPRYDVKINPNTGETERTRKPMSTGEILGAIALEAVSGAAAGYGVKNGPGNLGRATAAGFDQGKSQQADVNQKKLDQATADYARHAQVLETNMRMWQNAQTYGKQDYEEHQQYVGQYADLAKKLTDEYPGIIKAEVPESKLSDYHVTKDGAIPYRVVPRPDPNQPDGQARGPNGQKLWDNTYLVIDPSFKADGLLSPEDKATAAKYHLQGFVDGNGKPVKLPDNLSLSLGMVLNYKSQISSLQAMEGELNSYHDVISKPATNAPTNVPAVKDARIQALADKYADQYNVPKAYVRAIINQESGGNQGAVSPKGAIGVMQLMPATAHGLGVDPNDLEQNIQGGVKYFSQLLTQFKDPKLALAAYNAGPEKVTNGVPNIPETQNYVKSISNAVGLGNEPTPVTAPTGAVDLTKAIAADHTLAPAISKAQAYINAAGGDIPKGLAAYSKADSYNAGKVLPLFGGGEGLQQYEINKTLNLRQQEENIKDTAELNRQALDRQAKEQEKQEDYAEVAKDIAGDPNDPGSGDLTALDKLISQRTADRPKVYAAIKRINPNWSPAAAEGKLAVYKGFTDPNGKGTQQVTSFNTFMQHVGDGITVNDRYRRLNSPLLNEPYNWLEKNAANNPAVGEFMAAQSPIKSEFLTLLQNNHALTESDKEEGEKLVSLADTPARFEGVMKQMANTAAIRIHATNSQWSRVFGQGHNVPGMIDQDTVGAIQKLTDPHGNNAAANVLKDMDVGGTITGSADGRGVPGKRLGDLVQTGTQPKFLPGLTPIGKNPQTGQIIAKNPQGQYVDATTGQPITGGTSGPTQQQ